MKDSDEFSFLKETFKSLGNQYFDSSEIIIGPGDDAGLVKNSQDTIYSVDASVAGVHFPENLAAEHVAFRSLSTAASDVVACGGALKWILVSLTVDNVDLHWMQKFVKGLKNFSDEYSCPILGGDLSKGKQCNIAVTVCGKLNKQNFMKRSGAKIGDKIFVTNELGLAKKGLEEINLNPEEINLSSKNVIKFIRPKLHLNFGQEISHLVNSCIDISDGLISDLGHICEASDVGAQLNADSIPFEGVIEEALSWGDDYELCFTAAAGMESEVEALGKKYGLRITQIGEITTNLGVEVYKNGHLVNFKKTGYNHFDE
jgi:thiamine-monophosphate kinase